MKMIDNVTTTVHDDLQQTIHKDSKLSIAAACFSIYAYQELKKQLESVEEIRFIFTSPTFIREKTPRETGQNVFRYDGTLQGRNHNE